MLPVKVRGEIEISMKKGLGSIRIEGSPFQKFFFLTTLLINIFYVSVSGKVIQIDYFFFFNYWIGIFFFSALNLNWHQPCKNIKCPILFFQSWLKPIDIYNMMPLNLKISTQCLNFFHFWILSNENQTCWDFTRMGRLFLMNDNCFHFKTALLSVN